MTDRRTRGKAFGLATVLALALAGGWTREAGAFDALQPPTPIPTPTPNEQGQIIYIVQPGDTLWRIAAIAGMTLEELMALNGIHSSDILSNGAQLLLGAVVPTPGPEAQVTATPLPATPTPLVGTGEICVLLFQDLNGNARVDAGEGPLTQGQVSVVDRSGTLAGEHTTDEAPEGYCFTDVQDGDYNVSAAVPPDHNATTSMNVPVRLRPGEIHYVEFGAQPSAALQAAGQGEGQSRSPLLGIVGLVLLGVAGLLGYQASRYTQQRPTLGR
jgi:LysM repeat protein